jgi:hypothetical protein
MSLILSDANHLSNTAAYKSFYYGYAEDTVNTCHLIVRCDALMNGPVDVTGNVNIDGDLSVTGTITGALQLVYTVTYQDADFAIPAEYASTFNVYQVNTSAAPITVTLPAIATLDAQKKREIKIVDVGGNLHANPLTIVASGTDTIAGDTSVLVQLDYSGIHLVSNADVAPAAPTGKWLIA